MLKNIKDYAELNDGLKMPWVGFGVFKVPEGETVERAVREALDLGYRSIDTAAFYQNERGVGKAIRESGIPREEIFVTTKVWNDALRSGRTLEAFDESMRRLDIGYLDLFLIHWPIKGRYLEAWKVLEQIHQDGRVKSIGVSNFLIHHLEDLLRSSQTVPVVNQVEFHPYLFQADLLKFCQERKIQLEAWSPLAKGQIAADPRIQKLAEKYHRTPAQVVLRWDLQHGIVTIPKSTTRTRIAENMAIFDFELSAEDMLALDAMNEDRRTGPHPDTISE